MVHDLLNEVFQIFSIEQYPDSLFILFKNNKISWYYQILFLFSSINTSTLQSYDSVELNNKKNTILSHEIINLKNKDVILILNCETENKTYLFLNITIIL